MELLIGMVGAIIGIGLFIGGFFLGYKMNKPRPIVMQELSQEEKDQQRAERDKLIEDQSAFKDLLGYNFDTAYQIGNSRKA